jgi:hypothetical protein
VKIVLCGSYLQVLNPNVLMQVAPVIAPINLIIVNAKKTTINPAMA